MGHRPCQRHTFMFGHATEKYRHRERSRLSFGDGAIGQANNEMLNLGGIKRVAITFTTDQFLRNHGQ